jgi:NifU-like protein involved in Fe-S cluster formation
MEQGVSIDPRYLELLLNPTNYGEMEGFDAKGYGKNQQTGEMVVIYLKIDPQNQQITDIKWQTNGCGTTLVTGSLLSQEYKGKSIQEGISFTNAIFDKIAHNPPPDAACGEVVARAFLAAVEDYKARQAGEVKDHVHLVTLSCPQPEEEHGDD